MITPRSSSMQGIRTCLALFVVGGAVVAGCASARGDARTADLRDLHQKQIAEKSESERARLQHNFRNFRELSASEQDGLRLLNRALKEDDRDKGGLRAIMIKYHDWLATLTPGQRDDLSKTTDPNMREKRVRELLKEQREQAESTGSASGSKAQRGLSSDDLAAVLGVVEKALRERQFLSEEDKEQLRKKVGLARHMYVVERAYLRPGIPPRQQVGFTPKVGEAMIGSISNLNQKKFLQSRDRPEDRLWGMFNLIRAGLMSEYASHNLDPATLELFFVQLPSDKQDEIMRLPFDRQQQKLTHMYLEKKSDDDPDHYPRPPRPGFWMQRPAGFRPQGPPGSAPGSEPQRGADGDQSQKGNARKKNNRNAPRKNNATSEPDDASGKPDG